MSFLKLQNDRNILPNKFADLHIFNSDLDDDTKENASSSTANEPVYQDYNHFFSYNEKDKKFDENFLEDLLKNILSTNGPNGPNAPTVDSAEFLGENSSNNSDTQVVQVNEDDIIDQTSEINQLFHVNLIEKYDCRCDVNSSQFVPKFVKFSKALQRKLVNFNQLLEMHETSRPSLQKIDG